LAKRLAAATCLAVAIGTALGSASALAMNPLPLPLIGALLPTQDEESDASADQFAEGEEGEEATVDEGEDADAGDKGAADEESGEGFAESDEQESEPEPEEDAAEEAEEEQEAEEEPVPEPEEDVAAPPAEPEPPAPPEPPSPPPAPAQPAAPVPVTPSSRSAGWDDPEDTTIYKVVMNHEEQYSIWQANREIPLGWNAVGKSGTKQECLDYIESVWTDMRPLSLRKKMEEMERQSGGE
jgi:MbtH protein